MKTLTEDYLATIEGGNLADSFCAGVTAAYITYGAAIMLLSVTPMGQAAHALAGACTVYGLYRWASTVF